MASDIYNRIADVLNNKVTVEEVEDACEKLREDGLSVQTYADAATVAVALTAMEYLPRDYATQATLERAHSHYENGERTERTRWYARRAEIELESARE